MKRAGVVVLAVALGGSAAAAQKNASKLHPRDVFVRVTDQRGAPVRRAAR